VVLKLQQTQINTHSTTSVSAQRGNILYCRFGLALNKCNVQLCWSWYCCCTKAINITKTRCSISNCVQNLSSQTC